MNEYVLFIGALILLSLDIQDNFQFQISNFFFWFIFKWYFVCCPLMCILKQV